MNKSKSVLWIFGIFLIAGFFATNYTLNHFYVNGGYMLDSGWFAYLSAHSTNWPASNPPSIGGTYFSTHFSPAFYIFTALHTLLSIIGVIVSDVSWFSITQGFWLALTASSIFSLLSCNSKPTAASNSFIAATSIFVAFNGIFLASIGFPHFEIAIPALLVAFFACYINGHTKTAIFFLCLGLLMREDAGLHYFGLFFLLAGYLYFASGRRISKKIRSYALLAVICFVYSLLAICMQKVYFNVDDNALARVYLGDPAFGHISLNFLRERLAFFAKNRIYITAPIILVLFLSIYKKSLVLLIGVGAVLPWIIFSLLAIQFQAGTLTSYYSFPISIALFWPAIAYALFSKQNRGDLIKFRISTKHISVIALSSLVFYAGSYGNHDSSPWKNFGPKWIWQINSAYSSLDDFIRANSELKLILDDSVASLLNSTATPLQWRYNLAFSNDEIMASNAVLFQPGAWLTGRVKEVAGTAGFRYLCHIPNTNFAVLSRLDNIKKCQASEQQEWIAPCLNCPPKVGQISRGLMKNTKQNSSSRWSRTFWMAAGDQAVGTLVVSSWGEDPHLGESLPPARHRWTKAQAQQVQYAIQAAVVVSSVTWAAIESTSRGGLWHPQSQSNRGLAASLTKAAWSGLIYMHS